MHKTVYLFVILFFCIAALSFAQGWREGEMEIRVELKSADNASLLHALKLNGDIYSGHALLYVVPSELKRIEKAGIEYSIQKEDLHAYYQHFWERTESYHSYQEIIDLMDSLSNAFPAFCKKYVLGQSVEGREISYLKISDNVMVDEYEPEVLIDGGIHGNEIGGSENCIRFARMLCLEYGNNPDITYLIDNREIMIYPMVNPDGRESMARYNANGVDLNRDFGYMWDGWGNSPAAFSQVESKKLRNLLMDNQFSIYLSLHSGDEVLIYPWYYRNNFCPDHDAMDYLASQYVNASGYSNLDYGPGASALYNVNGGSPETAYGDLGNYGYIMEISENKQPPPEELLHYYNINEAPMLSLIENAGYGLKGTVSNEFGNAVQASLRISNQLPVYTDPLSGDFHKFLTPGTYSLQVKANGYKDTIINDILIANHTSLAIQNVSLQAESGQYVYRIIGCQIPNNSYADEGASWEAIGRPDSINYSIGRNGWVVLDVLTPIINGEGKDFTVYEGDDTPESYTCYVSFGMDGPWFELGEATGTTDFDLSEVIINSARYVKLVDDGDGTFGENAGFDLDAVQVVQHSPGIFLALSEYSVWDTTTGNGNHHIEPGETVDLLVGLHNTGDNTAQNAQGAIDADPLYTTINTGSANFGNIPANDTAFGIFNFSISESTPQGHPLIVNLDVTSNSGTYQNSYEMNFIVGKTPVLIIDLDKNLSSGPIIAKSCEDIGVTYEYRKEIPSDLSFYQSVFLCLGVFEENHILSQAEGQKLADFLDDKGDLYMEGGDTWYYDASTPVHPYFNIQGLSDGNGDLGTLSGLPGFISDGMAFEYAGENSFIDRIQPIDYAVKLFDNLNPGYTCAVANEGGTYQTVGASFEFGGLTDSIPPSTKAELLQRILNFFNGVYTGIKPRTENNNFHCGLFPNPCKKDFYITFGPETDEHISIDIYNLTGQLIYTKKGMNIKDGMIRISFDDIFAGRKSKSAAVYYVNIQSNKHTITKKLIKVN